MFVPVHLSNFTAWDIGTLPQVVFESFVGEKETRKKKKNLVNFSRLGFTTFGRLKVDPEAC